MATAKKSTSTKKAPVRKPSAAKRVAPKKTLSRKAPVKKTVARKNSKSSDNYETFKISRDTPPLMSFAITKQTVYWVIIMAFVIFFQLWIIKIQLEVSQIINSQQSQLIQDS